MDSKEKKSALEEVKGVSDVEVTNLNAISKIKSLRKKQIDIDDLFQKIISGDRVALSRGITLIESTKPTDAQNAQILINKCLPYANNSVRIGITGVPGVGKSTFIESFGTYLTSLGNKVAVLAIDPSSSLSKGSILGDKTRMEELVKDENAYIRPSASGDTLGGVARKTRESVILCEAAGYSVIIIETVGVGQSETAVHSMVDFFLLLKLSGAGDELQGIKRGIMEMADAIIINKADGDNVKRANLAKTEFNRALHLFPLKKSGWTPRVTVASAVEKTGLEDIWVTIKKYLELTKSNNYFNDNRMQQNYFWLTESIANELTSRFYNNELISNKIQFYSNAVKESKMSPFTAAEELLNFYENNINNKSLM